ncbi:MAG: MinD/ParA family protein [Alphaproteobacteria bacterium]
MHDLATSRQLPAAETSSRPSRRRTIALASGKGGVGKTWLSITLADALARRGHRTLLFDGDLGLANVDVQLGLMPTRDLSEVVANRARLVDIVLECKTAGFEIIAGRSGSGSLATIPAHLLGVLLDELSELMEDYERVIVDLGAGIDQTVRSLAGRADMIVVVTTDDPTAITDAYAFIKLMVLRNPQVDIRILVNQARSHEAGRRTYETVRLACENFLRVSPPLVGTVRSDRSVRHAIKAQVPVLTRSPNCDAATDVMAIATNLS